MVSGSNSVIASAKVTKASVDRYLNSVKLVFTAGTKNQENLPWVAFENISILTKDGYQIQELNISDFSKWKKISENKYEVEVYQGNLKVSANLDYLFRIGIESDSDTPDNDTWDIAVPDGGVVVWSQATEHIRHTSPTKINLMFTKEQKVDVGVTVKPSCEIIVDKPIYKLGETIQISWKGQNAGSAGFKVSTSGKDTLPLPGDKLEANGKVEVVANVIGNPLVTLVVRSLPGSNLTNECSVRVSIIATTAMKPTPRFNGLRGMTTATIEVSAVFGKPAGGTPAVTGPVKLGTVNWGDGVIENASTLITGSEMMVMLKHTYKNSGTYAITLTDLGGKYVSEKVSVVVNPVVPPKPVSPSMATSTPTPIVRGASTDVLSQIGITLQSISRILDTLETN